MEVLTFNAVPGSHEIGLVRFFTRLKLRRNGYNRQQAWAMASQAASGKILAFLEAAWAKYGPTILAILKAVAALVAMLMMTQAPQYVYHDPNEGDEEDRIIDALEFFGGDPSPMTAHAAEFGVGLDQPIPPADGGWVPPPGYDPVRVRPSDVSATAFGAGVMTAAEMTGKDILDAADPQPDPFPTPDMPDMPDPAPQDSGCGSGGGCE